MNREIFDRDEEIAILRRRLSAAKSLLVYGPPGVGKTLLLMELLPEFPCALYCPASSSPHSVLKKVAELLVRQKDRTVEKICKGGIASLLQKSSVSQKGIVMNALRAGTYMIVMDHLNRPSQAFAAMVHELMYSCSTPVVAVARSAHMEDVGFLLPMLSDRSEKQAIKNFDPATAEQFAERACTSKGLAAANLDAILSSILECSAGNPGAIVRLIDMATQTKYRSDDRIKWSPLYIDFRMEWATANAN